MKTSFNNPPCRRLWLFFLALTLGLFAAPTARAGLQIDMHLYGSYYCFPWLSTNSTPPSPTNTAYFVWSPSSTINSGIHFQLNPDNSINGSGSSVFPDYQAFIHEITNGNWTLLVTNAISTNQYTFAVTVPATITSNLFAPAIITSPTSGQINVASTPTFAWTGPVGWEGSLNVNDDSVDNNGNNNYVTSANLTSDQISWPSPVALPNGTNNFSVSYVSNATAIVTVSIPVDSLADPFPGFSYISTLESDANQEFTVGTSSELVANGGFETGDFTDWTLSGGGDIYVDDGSLSGTTPHSGNYEAEFGTPGELGYISQTLATTPGATYLLSFWLNSPDGLTPNEFQVSWNGTNLFDETDLPAIGWTNLQFVVTATGSSTVLQFGAQDDQSYLALDDVSAVATSGGHTNIAHYTFDSSGSLGQDSSGNGNDLDSYTYWGPVQQFNADAEAGSGAVQFFGTSSMDADNPVLTNLNAVLAGSFTFSAWVKTTVTNGADDDNAFDGAVIFWAYNDQGNTNDTIPLAITGSKAAFTTRDHLGNSTTLHSDTSVNDGNYHLITVTRDQATGQKIIYVDGNFEASEIGTTDPLNGNNYNLNIGGDDYYTDDTGTNFSSYNGLLDDVQIYTGVLSATEVASLYANPGNTIPDVAGSSGGLVVHYDFDEGTVLASDVSGNNNNIVYAGNFGGSGPAISSDAEAGAGAVSFDGGSYLTASPNLLATLAGDFTVSLWLNTSQSYGNPGGLAWEGAGVLCADSPNPSARDLIPVALTGGQVAFNVGDGSGNDDTLNSSATVNDGNWHHIVVTRSQATGQRQIFIDGMPDSSDTATTGLLNSPVLLTVGALSDASNPDPTSPDENGYNGYQGLLDDIQIYNRVLSADEVTYLYNNPGQTIGGSGSTDFITLNPFDQTNHPGYPVWLSAAADNNPSASWQWYKVGSGAIPNATSSYFIPADSGSASVAGGYYAIASNGADLANTTTAAVTFVTAPLPPDWSRAFKSPFTAVDDTTVTKDYYYGCIVDTNGNLYVAAEFGGNTTVGSLNLNSGTSGDAAAIVKQSPTGSPLWAVGITNNGDGSSYSYGECVAPAPDGGVYLSGNFYGTNWLGTNQLTDNGGGDIFIARFDANGSNLWVKTFGSTNSDFQTINTLASDPAGNVTFVGLLNQGPVTIGSNNYTVVGQQGVLVQLDQTGAVRWSQLLPSEKPLHLTYAAGRLYTSFNTETSGGTTNMVVGTISNLTDRAWAVACLDDANGDAIWLRGVGGISGGNAGVSLIDDVPRLAVSGSNLFVIGTAYGSSAAFGPLTVYFNDSRGQYFARYDTNGNAQVATTFGSPTTQPLATVANATGVYVAGNFDEAAFFGNNLIGAPSNTIPYNGDFGQAFVAKFDTNGNPLWAREAVSPATVNLLGIALASNGVWASGWTLSALSLGIESTAFGTNNVFSDRQYDYFGGAGGSYIIYWNPGGVLAEITDSALAASPVTLLNPLNNGANFQFQFLSQSGFSHNILYRTNLATGFWQTNSTVTGDGTVKTITLPFSLFSPSKQGFIRVSTQ